jgi:hypothetical protein
MLCCALHIQDLKDSIPFRNPLPMWPNLKHIDIRSEKYPFLSHIQRTELHILLKTETQLRQKFLKLTNIINIYHFIWLRVSKSKIKNLAVSCGKDSDLSWQHSTTACMPSYNYHVPPRHANLTLKLSLLTCNYDIHVHNQIETVSKFKVY